MPLNDRPYVARWFQVTIDDEVSKESAIVASVEVAPVKAEVITQDVGGHLEQVKHVSKPVPGEITFKIGVADSSTLFKWIAKSWSGEVERRSGSIQTFDSDFNLVHEYEFKEALITETTVPTLDASSKEAFYITVKIQPEELTQKWATSGRRQTDILSARQKRFLVSNFRVDIDGLDTSRIFKVEALTLKQKVAKFTYGQAFRTHFEPVGIQVPNLTVSLPLLTAGKWLEWSETFLQEAENAFDNEKSATITLLTQDMKQSVFEIDCYNLGVLSITPDKADALAGQDMIKRVKADLYCQSMSFKLL